MESEWVDQVFFCGGCNLLTMVGIAGNIFSVATLYPSKYSRTKGLFYRYLYLTTYHLTCTQPAPAGTSPRSPWRTCCSSPSTWSTGDWQPLLSSSAV